MLFVAIGFAFLMGCEPKVQIEVGAIEMSASSNLTTANESLARKLHDTRWVAYSPTGFNPTLNPPTVPSEASILADLEVLRMAGFEGIVLYGSTIEDIPKLAAECGFLVMLGIWDISSDAELAAAVRAARLPAVVGTIVGNEGLLFHRYDLATLGKAMRHVRIKTGKPVSTTEVVETYHEKEEIVEWSDFLAVNAHPWFHSKREPKVAVEWTVAAWKSLLEVAGEKPLIFKEVGLPSAGDRVASTTAQAEYYATLSKTDVEFCWFEGFDVAWKTHLPIEPHWGLFSSSREPKPVVLAVNGKLCLNALDGFTPTGLIGVATQNPSLIAVDRCCRDKPQKGLFCWKVTCQGTAGSGEAGLAWQWPGSDWGAAKGADLRAYDKISFWIKGRKGGERVRLRFGGHASGKTKFPATIDIDLGEITLRREWQRVTRTLKGQDLSNVPTSLSWVVRVPSKDDVLVFYVDEPWLE